jgi:hypothetical protein
LVFIKDKLNNPHQLYDPIGTFIEEGISSFLKTYLLHKLRFSDSEQEQKEIRAFLASFNDEV